MIFIETNRLLLREVTSDDAGFILRLLNEPSFIQNIGDRGIRTLDDAQGYIKERLISSYEEHGFGLYIVTLKETDEKTGVCGLVKRKGLEDVDIGYAFLPEFWAKGLATEASLAVKNYAKTTIGLKKLAGITYPKNTTSVRVLEKIGLTFDKMIKLTEDEIELSLYSTEL